MAMRPALKKIVNLLKKQKTLSDIDGYYTAVMDDDKFEKFIKKHCLHLRNPVPIKAGTKWVSKSSNGTYHGEFKVDCNVIGVVQYIGTQLVLDKRSSIDKWSSISNCREEFGGEIYYLEQLSALDTELLEKIAKEV